jgi:Tol biopolymer transport system component
MNGLKGHHVGFVLLLVGMVFGGGRTTKADYVFGERVNVTATIPGIDAALETLDCFSYDGLEMYLTSFRGGGQGGMDVWVLRRATVDEAWKPPENLGPAVNTPNEEFNVCISADGLALYFQSNQSGTQGMWDVFVATRATKDSPWGQAVNLGLPINGPAGDGAPWISADGLELYFASDRADGYGDVDIYVATRPTPNAPWGDPVNLGPLVNGPHHECSIALSPDGLLLLFADITTFGNTPKPGGYGNGDIWIARRTSRSDPWQVLVNPGPPVNGPEIAANSRISPDGRTLYFCTGLDNVWNNWQMPILPAVDFNADKKVDLVDLVMLIDDWGTNQTLCDIGPMPWGDGKVDLEDLKVFMTHYEKENPPAQP